LVPSISIRKVAVCVAVAAGLLFLPVEGDLTHAVRITAFLGLLNVPFLFAPTPDGDEGPPVLVLIVSGALGLVCVVCAVIAWRSGNRLAVRINAAALIINALLSMPAFFVDIAAWVKLGAAVSVLLTATDATVAERLGLREQGESLAWHIRRSSIAAAELEQLAPPAVHRVATDGRTAAEVADAVAALTPWLR
jgi:hypothetical protein